MKRTNLFIKSFTLAMAIMIAGNSMSIGSMGKLTAKFISDDSNNIISKVHAAEASIFTGDYTYVQNDAKNPNPAIVPQADGSVAIAMFNGTIVQVNCATGVVPKVVTSAGVTASATTNGIAIAATTVGSGVVQVQDTVTGKTSVIAINVVTGAGASQPAQQVASAAYSYADSHKIVSSDGLLELNLDAMTYESSTTAFTPKIYYGADGILTMEAWGGQNINIPVLAINKSGYELAGSMIYQGSLKADCKGRTEKINGIRRAVIAGSQKDNNIVFHYSIYKVGTTTQVDTTDLPIRVITLESEDLANIRTSDIVLVDKSVILK